MINYISTRIAERRALRERRALFAILARELVVKAMVYEILMGDAS